MHHFFVGQEQISGDDVTITGSDVNHIRNVLRMKPGETVLISNGEGRDYVCRLVTLAGECVTASICSDCQRGTELSGRIYLFQSLPKADKLELIIQKAVELGVYEIIPVVTKRTVVKLEQGKVEAKLRRWNAIAESAAKQSKRAVIPKVLEPLAFAPAVELAKGLDRLMIPYELASGMAPLKEFLADLRPSMSAGVFIGPEGGFEEEEVALAVKSGAKPVSLGRRILRTETAGLCALSLLMVQLEG